MIQPIYSFCNHMIHMARNMPLLLSSLNQAVSRLAQHILSQTAIQREKIGLMIHTYSQHTVMGIVLEGIPALLHSLNNLVNSIALDLLLRIVITVPLFYLHHNLFALGFSCGFIFHREVREIVENVNNAYNIPQTLLECVLFFGGGGILAILTMPTSMVIATLYYSSQWGESLCRKGQEARSLPQANLY